MKFLLSQSQNQHILRILGLVKNIFLNGHPGLSQSQEKQKSDKSQKKKRV